MPPILISCFLASPWTPGQWQYSTKGTSIQERFSSVNVTLKRTITIYLSHTKIKAIIGFFLHSLLVQNWAQKYLFHLIILIIIFSPNLYDSKFCTLLTLVHSVSIQAGNIFFCVNSVLNTPLRSYNNISKIKRFNKLDESIIYLRTVWLDQYTDIQLPCQSHLEAIRNRID